MRIFFCFFILCISFLLAYSFDVKDYEVIRANSLKNIARLEILLGHRIIGRHWMSHRIGGNIVLG
ncbi:hypothetical protein CAEBREN_24037 [Caenorhabditis brenneri]|uniref:Uncharacterized protein n=1 Tax=Caenorhabditis brenneri TaxID=135651 RepID=G0M8X8_CAEBE|nr:hypothetical protein CAEBREN_24037 [Caenorhabditis brenneri]